MRRESLLIQVQMTVFGQSNLNFTYLLIVNDPTDFLVTRLMVKVKFGTVYKTLQAEYKL